MVELRPIAKHLISWKIMEIKGNQGGIKGKLKGNHMEHQGTYSEIMDKKY